LISATDWATLLADLAAAMAQSVSKDGQTVLTNFLNFGGNKASNLAAGTAVNDALIYNQTAAQLVSLNMNGGRLNEAQGADIADSATPNFDTATGNLLDVNGATAITAITLSQGREAVVRFTGVRTLTNNAVIILPGTANITTAAGDFAIFRGYAAGIVRCVGYFPASGLPLSGIATGIMHDYVGATPPTGFILADGRTLGSAASAATNRANADTVNLFTLLWNSMADAQATVSTGRGASAAADFAANKTITVPDFRGRTGIGKDDMGGSAANRVTNAISVIPGTTLGASGGDQSLQAHVHGGVQVFVNSSLGGGSGGAQTTTSSTASTGAGASQNMPPSYVVNKIIKL
jgi:hypothetical protein